MIYTLQKWIRKIAGLKKIDKQIIAEAQCRPGDRVMDVGCGTGMLLEELFKKYGNTVEYMGIEPDEPTRQRAEKEHASKGIKFKRAFANHLPSVQNYYTHVICRVSFHHFPKEEWKACLEEFKRILAPEGKLIIVEFGRPITVFGKLMSVLNPCSRLAIGLEEFLRTEAAKAGLRLSSESRQFGYLIHLVFTK